MRISNNFLSLLERAENRRAVYSGLVAFSNSSRYLIASARQLPHISPLGCSDLQNAGRSGELNILQLISSAKFTHGTPAGLPLGIPGMKLVIDGAMQQAPQFFRH